MPSRIAPFASVALAAAVALSGCGGRNELDLDSGAVGQRIQRSLCPAVGIPTYTGDVTLFDPPASRDAKAIDVVATIADLRTTCDAEATANPTLNTAASFRIDARRENVRGARDVTLPYFVTVMRGGGSVVSKQLGQVTLRFADGQARASADATGYAAIGRAAATLPEEVRQKITRKRKPEDADASIDPLADPTVKSAVARATFELLIGFQLTEQQLAYNATR